jgi:hypothetical protein
VQRLLAVVIALLIAGGIAAAIVKGGSDKVVAEPTPTQTYTYPGVPPTVGATDTEEPVIPSSETPEPSPTSTRLAGTGSRSMTGAAVVMLGLALCAGTIIARTARAPA